jgi:Rhodopirellula transposase DDE domain
MQAESVGRRFELLGWALDERLRRLFAATEAKVLGRGGVSAVAAATGVSRRAIHVGLQELAAQAPQDKPDRIRRPGAGRKRLIEQDPTLLADLERLIEPLTRGDPESPLRWTCKSLRRLSEELRAQGHRVSHTLVGQLLRGLGYSLQANAKTLEGSGHPDRNAQFEHINREIELRIGQGQPVISVDTKKKELIGPYKNNGRTWRADPYGVYDLAADAGWVSVGTDHDTVAFAVQTIRRWWQALGRPAYAGARELLITADGGGSNGSRVRLWRLELQRLADETGLSIRVCHFPPGTSKWNKIEHRLFSFLSMNWCGQPLIGHEVMINLIANTRTRTGLQVHAELDAAPYPKGLKVSDAEFDAINLARDTFHGDWNYTIHPQPLDA